MPTNGRRTEERHFVFFFFFLVLFKIRAVYLPRLRLIFVINFIFDTPETSSRSLLNVIKTFQIIVPARIVCPYFIFAETGTTLNQAVAISIKSDELRQSVMENGNLLNYSWNREQS